MLIDFHSHILPAIDHGCADALEAEQQLELMRSNKTDIAVATPHFYPHIHSTSDYVQNIDAAVAEIRSRLGEKKLGISLALGVEVLACETIDRMPDLDKLCIRGTRCLLLEMPACGEWGRLQIEAVKNLIDDGYDVILAHIGRYMRRYENQIDTLIAMGAMAQVNAEAFSTRTLRRKMMAYIDGGYVCALGSDIHGADKSSYKNFTKMERRIGAENFKSIMNKAQELLATAELIEL
ncbi:MAG: hypothetical protein J6A83_02250 [Clostridia bacterium]|nr:hypothetical protein [Clostridia bacterium]